MNGACAALRHAAPIFCSSETKVVADDPQQWSGRIDVEIEVFAVYREGNHYSLLSYAVCIGLVRGDRFSLCKLSSGTFSGYFSAIELVSGRRIFGNYCAPASLLGCSESPAF
jgi:hypothetical protein